MDEMIRYIFGSLRNSETTINIITKILKKQSAINRSISIFAVTYSLCIIVQSIVTDNMYSEIKNLKTEIKELKKTEGD